VSGSDGFTKIIDDAVDHAYVVLPACGTGRVEEMSMQTIDGDAKPERRGKAVLCAAAKGPCRIVNVAHTQPAARVWKGSGYPCPAGQYMSVGTQRVAIPNRKHRTE